MRWVSTTTTITSISTRLCTSSVTSLCTTCACAMTLWQKWSSKLMLVACKSWNAIWRNEELIAMEPTLEIYLVTNRWSHVCPNTLWWSLETFRLWPQTWGWHSCLVKCRILLLLSPYFPMGHPPYLICSRFPQIRVGMSNHFILFILSSYKIIYSSTHIEVLKHTRTHATSLLQSSLPNVGNLIPFAFVLHWRKIRVHELVWNMDSISTKFINAIFLKYLSRDWFSINFAYWKCIIL